MRKLAFETAGIGFEMPNLRMVNLEKENSLMLAIKTTPKTVYKGSTSSFSRSQVLQTALDDESDVLSLSAFVPKVEEEGGDINKG